MIIGKLNQIRCQACRGWHFALNTSEDGTGTLVELKCCRCGRLIAVEPKLNLLLDIKVTDEGLLKRPEVKVEK